MSNTSNGGTPTVYREFITAVEHLSQDGLRDSAEVAGWLSVGLSIAAEGIVGAPDSMGSTTAGP